MSKHLHLPVLVPIQTYQFIEQVISENRFIDWPGHKFSSVFRMLGCQKGYTAPPGTMQRSTIFTG
jgi:hypothetical protein